MCRLFGFRSIIQSQVHSSLVSAENALAIQSGDHPDGWGVAYYIHGSPHVVKSTQAAISDNIFKRLSGVVSSQTVLAHIRNATLGQKNILNTHPFQYGSWVFAHNGNIKNFDQYRDDITNEIPPHLRRFILGKTDSELLFYLVLSNINKRTELDIKNCDIHHIKEAIQESIQFLTQLVGDFSKVDNAGNTETYFTFIISNGHTMAAHHGGKNLFYSTYKKRCDERDTCPYFSPVCEQKTQSGIINHLLFSSEPLSGENIWTAMRPGQIIGIDSNMHLYLF